jgi:hypothetical protein
MRRKLYDTIAQWQLVSHYVIKEANKLLSVKLDGF